MVEITSETEKELRQIADEEGVEFETVADVFKEKFESVKERGQNVSEDMLENIALRSTRTAQLKRNRTPTSGVEIATIGGSIREWSDGDTFVGKGLVDVNPNEAGRPYLSTIIIKEDHVNLSDVQDAFSEVGNIVTGEFSVSEAHTDKFRVLNSQDDTDINLEVPDNGVRMDIISDIRDMVPEASIATIVDDMSQTERSDDGSVYPASFGVDIRRMTVDIYDGYQNPSKGSGAYTVGDETVFDDEDLKRSPVFDTENASENATPGLTCWTDPSLMKYGSSSVVEMFGVISKGRNGVATMNVDGIVPIFDEGEFDGYVDDSEESPEQTGSSNVDRTSI